IIRALCRRRLPYMGTVCAPPHISLMIYKWNEAQSATRQDFAGCFQFTPGEQPGIKPSFFHTDGANMSRTATMAPAKNIRRPTISLAAGSRCWTSSPNVAAKSVSTEISRPVRTIGNLFDAMFHAQAPPNDDTTASDNAHI